VSGKTNRLKAGKKQYNLPDIGRLVVARSTNHPKIRIRNRLLIDLGNLLVSDVVVDEYG